MRHARVFAGVATFMFASSNLTDAQTSAAAFSTPDDATSRALPWFESYADQDRITKK